MGKKPTDVNEYVPTGLRVAAAWAWRLIVVGVVLMVVAQVFGVLSTVLLPLAVALLIAAPLGRVVDLLVELRFNRTLASALTVATLVAVVVGLFVLAGNEIVRGFNRLQNAAVDGFETFLEWLQRDPVNLSSEKIDQAIDWVSSKLQENAAGLASGAISVTGTIGTLVAGGIIALIALFFFMRDGELMWRTVSHSLPGAPHERVYNAGMNAWRTLRKYSQTSAFVAFVDAVGIGLGAWLIGVPLAFPIAILVFLLSFIPMFGATISGVIAVLVALVDGGWVKALIMLGIVLLVQQLEGNVLYPYLFGRAASLHPIVILISVSSGTLLAGFIGAVLAVPLVSFVSAFIRGLRDDFEPENEAPSLAQRVQGVRLRRGKP